MHNSLVQDLAFILLIGGICAWIFKKYFNLPIILGYILAGIIFGIPSPYTPNLADQKEAHTLAEVGVLLLMFSMGLHFGVRKITSLGFAPIIVSLGQALLLWFVGIQVASLFQLDDNTVLFLGAVVATSSTTVIVKILEELKLKTARFAENLLAVLLIEDCIAIFIVLYLTTTQSVTSSLSIFQLFPLFIVSILVWWVLGTILVPRLVRSAAFWGKDELLVVITVGLALGLAYLSEISKFSPALGAFIMGSILAEAREIKRIEALIEPIKNLFGVMFFISVGLLFDPRVLPTHWMLILALSSTIIFGKIFFNLFLNLAVGRNLKDSIRIAGSMGQIGELSFVIAQAGFMIGALNPTMISVVVSTSIFTILLTPFTIRFSLWLADNAEQVLPLFIVKGIRSYSHSLSDFSLRTKVSPIARGFQPLGWFKSILAQFNILLKKNYMRMTSRNMTATLDRLAPWDEYLVQVSVAQGAKASGHTLIKLKLRDTIGVNIVAINREPAMIIAPNADEILLPGDVLLAYGNEEGISKLQALCMEQTDSMKQVTLDDCKLVSLYMNESHEFIGKSLNQLELRKRFNCVLLAVTRNDSKIKNPDSNFVFQERDELFLFGQKNSIVELREFYATNK